MVIIVTDCRRKTEMDFYNNDFLSHLKTLTFYSLSIFLLGVSTNAQRPLHHAGTMQVHGVLNCGVSFHQFIKHSGLLIKTLGLVGFYGANFLNIQGQAFLPFFMIFEFVLNNAVALCSLSV